MKGEKLIMKIINVGHTYHLYDDELKTYDKFQAGTYKINFNPMSGFSIIKSDNLCPSEEKVYGDHYTKINKVLHTYEQSKRSLGVLLSGDKGIGKSLFVQLLSQEFIKQGYPVFIIDKSYPDLINYIDKIKQEVVVIFDEFEKTFNQYDNDVDVDTQNDLLSLLDGTSNQKRLYLATINEISDVSEYFINRPGRFHYHFRFAYPNYDEIFAYLKDTTTASEQEVKKVAMFGEQVELNFDMLRAVANELNLGYSFEDSINDLNIINIESVDYEGMLRVRDNSGQMHEFIHIVSDVKLHNEQTQTVHVERYRQLSPNNHSMNCEYEFSFNNDCVKYQDNKIMIEPHELTMTVKDQNLKFDQSTDYSIELKARHKNDKYKYF